MGKLRPRERKGIGQKSHSNRSQTRNSVCRFAFFHDGIFSVMWALAGSSGNYQQVGVDLFGCGIFPALRNQISLAIGQVPHLLGKTSLKPEVLFLGAPVTTNIAKKLMAMMNLVPDLKSQRTLPHFYSP
jgi:hypothetical protein